VKQLVQKYIKDESNEPLFESVEKESEDEIPMF